MKNKANLFSVLVLGFFCVILFSQCGEESKKSSSNENENGAQLGSDSTNTVNSMADGTSKSAEELAAMTSKEGSLSFDKGTWAYDVLHGISTGNTTVFTLDQVSYNQEDDLTAEGAAQLDALADILKANPEWSIEIQGHTEKADNSIGAKKKIGTSKIRAAWVQAKMNVRGVSGKQISSKGYGDQQLLKNIDPKDQKHRRITISLEKSMDVES